MFRRLSSILQIVWTAGVISVAVVVGAVHGWENHGATGAIALGFCGLIIGGLLSEPRLLLSILS